MIQAARGGCPPDPDAALRFLAHMGADPATTWFQSYDDTTKERSSVIESMRGWDVTRLIALNADRASICWAPQVFNGGESRTAPNVVAVRCFQLDFEPKDAVPERPDARGRTKPAKRRVLGLTEGLAGVHAAGIAPTAVVNTSPGNGHVYVRVSDCPVGAYTSTLKALIERFGADPAPGVTGLQAVFRLPGFVHAKGTPFRSTLVSTGDRVYTLAEVCDLAGVGVQAEAWDDGPDDADNHHHHHHHNTWIAPALRRLGHTRGHIGRDGQLPIRCINEDEHTTEGKTSTVFLTRSGRFKCDHGHCSHLTQDDFWVGLGLYAAREEWLKSSGVWFDDLGPEPCPQWVRQVRDWTPPTDLATRVVNPQFAWRGWIQRGLVGALVAGGGTGKTTFLLTFGVHVALGRRFCGRDVQQGTFVLLSGDDSQEDLDGVLALVVQAMGLGPQETAQVARKLRVVSLQRSDGTKTFSEPGSGGMPVETLLVNDILSAVADIADLVGIALDTLRQFSGGLSNDEQIIKLTIAGATRVAGKTGAFVVLPHHTGKQNYRDGIDDLYCGSGSAAIGDNCRFVFLLQKAEWPDIASKVHLDKPPEGDAFVLTSTRGSLLVKTPSPVYLQRDGFRVEGVEGRLKSVSEQQKAKVLVMLQAIKDGCNSKRALQAKLGGNQKANSVLVALMVADGFVSLTGWVISITLKGLEMLRDST